MNKHYTKKPDDSNQIHFNAVLQSKVNFYIAVLISKTFAARFVFAFVLLEYDSVTILFKSVLQVCKAAAFLALTAEQLVHVFIFPDTET